jgi:hypothetical protein
MSDDAKRRQKNWALFTVLLSLAVVMFAVTIIRFGVGSPS